MTLQGAHRDTCIFSLAQQSYEGLGRPFNDVSRSYTIRHTHPLGLLSTSDQLIAETTTYKTHNKHKRQISIPLAEFEQVIPVIKQTQNYALDRTATGMP